MAREEQKAVLGAVAKDAVAMVVVETAMAVVGTERAVARVERVEAGLDSLAR